ncbi:hypothetical protein J5N97_010200 [Dioscorea zingiberensis]|uniref:Protein BIG GRAIN 1-like B n=1 Tax=Dioscorea zingiberensis TaxID=325984 RepID=A0A9D5HM82_9LILI|nr:hypothetical protein J5N97_010200 [Dioscorea zingiberensis]
MQRRSYQQYSMSTQSSSSASSAPSSLISTMARRHKDSDEIDVFEAARYFSGDTDSNVSAIRSVVGAHGGKREERHAWRPLRKSLDMPIGKMISQPPPNFEKRIINEKKSSKQPSSPGGRLASFLNSLFSQVTSKVKYKSSSSRKDDCEEANQGERRRRNSTSQYSPSLRASTSTKVNYKVINDEKKTLGKGVMEKKEVLKISGEDDGGESDSSSDLFELKNYELSDHHVISTTDLPVYGATNMKAIKREAAIA